jgi:hypothetical protein
MYGTYTVEYWIYQSKNGSSGSAKITADRIRRLQEIGFVWDPQGAVWNTMFAKLQGFVARHGHCRVPKGYADDMELANWVRNQRLEYANQLKLSSGVVSISSSGRQRGSRMTPERFELLNSLNFTWSTAMPHKWKKGTKRSSDGTELQPPPPTSVDLNEAAPLGEQQHQLPSNSSPTGIHKDGSKNEEPPTNGERVVAI